MTDHKDMISEKRRLVERIVYGSYPHVTSSNTVSAGACKGLGVAPNKIEDVFGIVKAHCTRVGSGPFPTELYDEEGELFRAKGHEFGATTGRPRRCGWLDLVALKYAIEINGVTQIILTKIDILSEFDTIKVCTQYKTKEGLIDYLPYSTEEDIVPQFEELNGWKTDVTNIRKENELPKELLEYGKFIEKETGVPVKIISVGPARDATIVR